MKTQTIVGSSVHLVFFDSSELQFVKPPSIECRCYVDIRNSPYSSGLIFDPQFYKVRQCQTPTLLWYGL